MNHRSICSLVIGLCLALVHGLQAQTTPVPSEKEKSSTTTSSSAPHVVTIGVFLTALYDSDAEDSSFLADFYVWTSQKNAGFDPLETTVFPGAWSSDIVFKTRQERDGVQWSLRRYRGTFYHDWNLFNFPFDKHELKFQFRDSVHRSREIEYVLDTENSGMGNRFDLPNWNVGDFVLGVDKVKYDTSFGDPWDSEPQTFTWITAKVVMERDAGRLFAKLLSGGYIAFAAAMFACWMKPFHPPVFSGRMVVQISSLFAAIINNRATDTAMGKNDQFTLPNLLHLIIYLMIFISMVITLRSRNLCEQGKEAESMAFERKATLMLVGIFVVANVVLIWRSALSPVQLAS